MTTKHDHDYYHDDCSLCQMEKESPDLQAQLKALQEENKRLRALLKRLEVAETVVNLALKE